MRNVSVFETEVVGADPTSSANYKKQYHYKWHQANKARRLPIMYEQKAARRKLARDFIISHLLEHPCVDCGETDPVVLEFDHLHSKVYSVATLVSLGYSLKKLKVEIEKCEVVCANCHRRRTATRGKFWKTLL